MRLRLALWMFAAACHTPSSPPSAAAEAGLQVQVVRLEHTQAAEVASRVQEQLAGSSASGARCRIVAQPAQNALVVSGTAAEIRSVVELVARLDLPSGR